MAANELRIIGGNWKGRKLRFNDAQGLRPTLGRVRETLFNWLNLRIDGARCLDLFAGSGALGFEALSRGATAVTLVEANRPTVKVLRENAARLEAGRACTIHCATANRFLRDAAAKWDVIFLDPPFEQTASQHGRPASGAGAGSLLTDTLERISRHGCLAPGGLIYFEMPRRLTARFPGFAVLREGTAGDTRYGLLEPEPGD